MYDLSLWPAFLVPFSRIIPSFLRYGLEAYGKVTNPLEFAPPVRIIDVSRLNSSLRA